MIKLIRSEKVTPTETHFEIDVNGKTVQFVKFIDADWITDYDFIKGEDDLTEEESEDVTNFIEEQEI